jgi:hypothetical protein
MYERIVSFSRVRRGSVIDYDAANWVAAYVMTFLGEKDSSSLMQSASLSYLKNVSERRREGFLWGYAQSHSKASRTG